MFYPDLPKLAIPGLLFAFFQAVCVIMYQVI